MQPPKTVSEAFRQLLGLISPNVDNLIRRFSVGNVKNRERPLIEFKASYLPGSNDPDSPDACRWNVIKAIVGMANSQGGCIVLGLKENDDKTLSRGNGDPEGILAQIGKEDKDLSNHTCHVLFRPTGSLQVSNNEIVKFNKKDFWLSLSAQTNGAKGFLTCKSHFGGDVDGFPVVVIFVDPIPENGELISVEVEKQSEKTGTRAEQWTEHSRVFYVRSETEAETLPLVREKWTTSQRKTIQSPSGEKTIIDQRRIDDQDNQRLDHEFISFVRSRDPEKALVALLQELGEVNRQSRQDTLPPGVLYGRDGREQLFVGRKGELESVRKALSENGVVVVHGGGGKGKTTLVERVANEWLESVDGHAFWINAERIQDWKSLISALVGLDKRIRGWLGANPETQLEDKLFDEKQSFGKLLDKCHEEGPILLILDNIEEPGLFSDQTIQDWFGERFPNHFHVLATSRIGIAKTITFCPARQIPLGYLASSEARELLVAIAYEPDRTADNLSNDERKALDELVALTRGHAWTIHVIGSFLKESSDPDDFSSKPMSFRTAVEIYRNRGMSEFSPDDPQQLRKLLAPTLERIRSLPKGEDLFNMARLASLVARDGIAEKHVLRAFLKQVAGADDSAFDQAVRILVRYSLFDAASETTVEMHRNTQEVLQKEIGSVFCDRAGSFLSTYPGLELRHWPEFLQNGVPSDFCPVRLLDFRTLQRVLPLDWSLLKPDMVSAFSASEMCWLLENGPEEILDLPWLWGKLEEIHPDRDYAYGIPGCCTYRYPKGPRGSYCPSYWPEVLSKIPSLVRHCNLSSLSHDDLGVIVRQHPSIMDEQSFFKNNPKGLPHYLIAHPESISEQCLSLLDPEGWMFLADMTPSLRNRMPTPIRSLLARIEQVREAREKEREEMEADDHASDEFDEADSWWAEANNLSQLYGVDLLSKEEFLKSDDGRAMAVYLAVNPEDATLRFLDPLEPDDWAILYAEKPEFIEEFGSDKLLGATHEGWAGALCSNPHLIPACPAEFDQAGGINMFSGDQLIDIVTRTPQLLTPQLLTRCREQFSGVNWAVLVQRFPRLADYCPWNRLSPKEVASVLVNHPEWAHQYKLSFDGLDDLQWAQLLSRNPAYRNQCHCRFTERSAKDLVAAIKCDPTILNSLSGEEQSVFFDPLLLFSRQKYEELPWISLVAPNRFHYYGSYKKVDDKTDFYHEWRKRLLRVKWEALNPSEWKQLLLKHPDCRDEFQQAKAWRCFSGNDWRDVLNDCPWLYEFCDWGKLSVKNWISLLGKHDRANGFVFGFNEQRQLSEFLPGDFGTAELLEIFSSLPWLEQALRVDHPARARLNRERNRFCDNLLSGRTVIDLKPEEFSWPHPALASFCGNMDQFPANEQLTILVREINHSFSPLDEGRELKELSSLIFDNEDISELEACRLQRRILFALTQRSLWDEADVILNRLPELVQRTKEFPGDKNYSDLSLATTDKFACFCKGEILWAKGNFSGAACAFEAAQDKDSLVSFEAFFDVPEKTSYANWDGRIRIPKSIKDAGRPSVSDIQLKLAFSDCENKIPQEQSTYRWAKTLRIV